MFQGGGKEGGKWDNGQNGLQKGRGYEARAYAVESGV